MLALRVSLGLRIEEIRISLQLSREDLANVVGIDPRHVANCELYGAWPEPETLEKIAAAFGLDLHDLVDFTETRRIPTLSLEKRLNRRISRSKKSRTPQKPRSPRS